MNKAVKNMKFLFNISKNFMSAITILLYASFEVMGGPYNTSGALHTLINS
jgi:hypothetical protein